MRFSFFMIFVSYNKECLKWQLCSSLMFYGACKNRNWLFEGSPQKLTAFHDHCVLTFFMRIKLLTNLRIVFKAGVVFVYQVLNVLFGFSCRFCNRVPSKTLHSSLDCESLVTHISLFDLLKRCHGLRRN